MRVSEFSGIGKTRLNGFIRKYFGADDIRGTVGQSLITPDFVLRLAHAVRRVLKRAEARPTVLLLRPYEVSSGIANPLVLKVGHHALRRLLEHDHVLTRSSTQFGFGSHRHTPAHLLIFNSCLRPSDGGFKPF